MTDDLPIRVWSGTFDIWGVTLHCHVLSNGVRIIEADDIARLFDRMGDANCIEGEGDLSGFAKWQSGV